MRLSTQNLTADYGDRKERPIWLAGRSAVYGGNDDYKPLLRWEWALFGRARDPAITLTFGSGENGDDVLLHVCIPFVATLYFILCGVKRCREQKTGIAIHNGGLWIYPLVWEDEHKSDDPWYRKWLHWEFPWTLAWFRTEILSHDGKDVVWSETVKDRKNWHESFAEREKAKASVSKAYPYRYVRKNGEVQERVATVHICRMSWRARWYPLIWLNKVDTSIDVQFNEEVGEGTGSWKGGCVGCGATMLPGESAEQTLRRMEAERKFGR